MGFYLATHSNVTSADISIGSCTFTSLGVGATTSCSGPLTVPSWLASGTYYGGAIADDQSQLDETNESNNTLVASNTLTVSSGAKPDLIVSSVSIPASIAVGASGTFSAVVLNQGNAAAGAFRVSFYLSSNTNIATGTNIGNCTLTSLAVGATSNCSGPLTVSLAAGTYYGGAIVDDQSQVDESNESNNTLLASNTLTVSSGVKPDLIVSSVSIPASATVGASATFSAVVLNQGNAAAGAFRVSFYLSNSTNIAGGTNIGNCTVTSLAVGATSNCSGPLTVNLAAGAYYGGAIADDQGQVSESNESNNTLVASNTLTVSNGAKPDLIVSSVSIPASVTVGASATFSAVVLNQGNAAAGAFRVSFYLSSSTNIAGGTNIGNCTVTSLAVGATSNCSGPLTVSLAAGTYYGGAIVDDQGQVDESNESNNTLLASNTLTVTNGAKPDLTVSSVTIPASVTVGASATFSAVVLNQGNAAAGAFRVSFYLSSSTNIAGGTNVGNCTVTSLAVGATSNCSGPLTVSLAAGTYYGGAIVDDQGQIDESNESNDTLVASNTLTVSNGAKPDLIVSSVSIPTSVTVGATATFSAVVLNQGNAAAGAFRVSFYLSNSTNIAGGTNIGNCTVTSLAVGATSNCSGPLTVSLSAGTYFGGAIVDDQSQVDESNESNNTLVASSTLTVTNGAKPDLIVSSVTIPASVTVGASATFSAVVLNQGNASAGAFRVSFYLSSSTNIAGGTNIGNCTVTSLAVGATSNCSGPLTVSLAAGTYYGGAIADDQNQVAESNESNNTLLASNTLTVSNGAKPDLVVSSVSIPASVTVGASATFSAVVLNQGNAAAGAFRVSFYLSSSTNIAGGTNIGNCTVTSLAVGATSNCSGPLTVSLAAATYYGGAIADDQGQVAESNESNNTLLASNTLTVRSSCSTTFCAGDVLTVHNTGGSGLNLRSCASTSCGVIVNMPDGTQMTVQGGSVSANGFVWWNLSGFVGGTSRNGWAVQDYLKR